MALNDRLISAGIWWLKTASLSTYNGIEKPPVVVCQSQHKLVETDGNHYPIIVPCNFKFSLEFVRGSSDRSCTLVMWYSGSSEMTWYCEFVMSLCNMLFFLYIPLSSAKMATTVILSPSVCIWFNLDVEEKKNNVDFAKNVFGIVI